MPSGASSVNYHSEQHTVVFALYLAVEPLFLLLRDRPKCSVELTPYVILQHKAGLRNKQLGQPWKWPVHAKGGTVNLSHPSHSPLEDAELPASPHIPHRCGNGYMYVITAIRLRC